MNTFDILLVLIICVFFVAAGFMVGVFATPAKIIQDDGGRFLLRRYAPYSMYLGRNDYWYVTRWRALEEGWWDRADAEAALAEWKAENPGFMGWLL